MKSVQFVFSALLLCASFIASAEPIRILHVMSYHSSWEWNKDQFSAFKGELSDSSVEYRIVELDGKRVSKEELQRRASDTIQIIKDWKLE